MSVWQFIWVFIRRRWVSVLGIQILWLAWSVEHIAWPQIIRVIVDSLSSHVGPRELIWEQVGGVIMLACFLWLGIEVMMRLAGILSARILPKIEADARMAMFEHTMWQSHTYFTTNYPGALANKINDMPHSIGDIIVMCTGTFIPNFVTIVVITVLFVSMSPIFGILVCGWVMAHFGISIYTFKKSKMLSAVHAESRSNLTGTIVDVFMNNGLIRLFARSRHEISVVNNYQEDERNKNTAALMYVEKVKVVMGIICFLFIGVFLTSFEIYCYKEGMIDIGDIVFIFQGTTNVVMATWLAVMQLPQLFEAIGVAEQALSIMREVPQIRDVEGAIDVVVRKGDIEFKNVTFKYEGQSKLFDAQSLMIPSGQKVGLVGFSGGGKTTFVNLMLRYFDIQGGEILIDGNNIAHVTQESLRRSIAMIPQDAMMFHRSIKENIGYGNLEATEGEIIEAAKKARCHDFIMTLKEGYNTVVGDRGSKISGGQRQRIAIARAVLKKAPILIMDEATSALDSITENDIQESISEIAKGKTTIIIAHRLSTLMDVDRILVFKDGKIIEDGSHDELYEHKGHYRELWDMQVDGFIPDEDEEVA